MSTKESKGRPRVDRTGETHESVYVMGRHPLNQHHWQIRWKCCGREQEITPERLSVIVRTLPVRCINCVKEHAIKNPEYYSDKAIRDREQRELKAAQKMAENRPEEVAASGVQDRLGRWWPALGALGARWGC